MFLARAWVHYAAVSLNFSLKNLSLEDSSETAMFQEEANSNLDNPSVYVIAETSISVRGSLFSESKSQGIRSVEHCGPD